MCGRFAYGNQRTKSALDPYGFRRAMTRLGWEPAHLVVAEHPWTRLFGMIPCSYGVRNTRPPTIVMGFPRCGSIHTCFMRQALDVAFLSRTGEVLAVCREVAPWRVLSCREAASVIERIAL